MSIHAPSGEQLERTLSIFAGHPFPASLWESVILPARVKGYRESLLDAILAEGTFFWHMEEGGMLRFDDPENTDWEADLSPNLETLSEKEQIIYQALLKRGASFMQALKGLLEGESSPRDSAPSFWKRVLYMQNSFGPRQTVA